MFEVYIDYTKRMFELLEFDVKEVPVVAGMRNGPAREKRVWTLFSRISVHRWFRNLGPISGIIKWKAIKKNRLFDISGQIGRK